VAGAIHSLKGQLSILEVFAIWKSERNRDFKIFIAGSINDDEYYNKMKTFIADNQLTNHIIFEGFVEDMEDYYSRLDVLICGSRSEAFGRVVIESMLRGIFVIARNIGGVPEIIEHGKYGLLYNTDKELLNCIDWYYENKCKAQEIKQNAFNMVKERFSLELYSNQMMEILLQKN
jgi:glycosyltransferase involved in cell wall biosynthesis